MNELGYKHEIIRKDADIGDNLLPRCHRIAALFKRWLMGTHQGGINHEHLDYYLDEYTFGLIETSHHRGKLFYRLIQQAVVTKPSPYGQIVKGVRRLKILSIQYVVYTSLKGIPPFILIQGDAVVLPIKDNSFDVVIATAIIEHVSEPIQLIREAFQRSARNGIFIVTTPHPFWGRDCYVYWPFKKEEHHELITLMKLISLFNTAGFEIVNAEQFMISPIGMPFELTLEKILKFFRLNFLLLNQIIVGRK